MEDARVQPTAIVKTLLALESTFIHHVACNCGSEIDPDNMIVAQTCACCAALCGMEVSSMRMSSMKPQACSVFGASH